MEQIKEMNKESTGFTATQTDKGFHVTYFDSPQEVEVSVHDLNEFANKYSQEMLEGKLKDLTEVEELMFSLWEMVLIPDDTKH